jgi:hypothetical protein
MPNIISLSVKLKTVNGVTSLDVEQANNANHVPQNAQAQTIQWQLEGNAASGSFLALDGTPPGFAWKSNPAPSSTIFSAPSRSSNGNTLTITDLNNSAATQGQWIYQLYATVNGTTYSTNVISLKATTDNPSIKNN